MAPICCYNSNNMSDDVISESNRRSERKAAQMTVTLVIEGDEADEIATALDLSQHGMRLQTDIALAPGQRVGLLLSDTPSYILGARVAWVGKSDSGQAGQVGMEFTTPLSAQV
jgi:hypothetical protein